MNTEDYIEIEREIKLEQKRGNLLSILCILTFVGAAIDILSALYSFATLDSYLHSLQSTYDFLSTSGSDPNSLHLRKSVGAEIDVLGSWGKIGFIGKIIAAAVCLFGAWMMWNLKKKGFKIYVAGQLISLIVTFLILRGVGGLFASYYMAWIIIPLVFTGLYAISLKKMN